MNAPAEDNFVQDPTRGWTMAEPAKPTRARIHAAECAVPDAFFADDPRCTCGLRDAIDAMGLAGA